MALNKIPTAVIREGWATVISDGFSQTMAAKAYRLLRAILMTAGVEDWLITPDLCQIKGADKEDPRASSTDCRSGARAR
jgi:hypothetical protein